jgi:hypothetical protein
MKAKNFTNEELEAIKNPPVVAAQNESNPIQQIIGTQDNNNDGNYWPIDNLPSKYSLYPKGTKIYARPLKVLEVKMLSSLTNDNFHFVITEVLKKSTKGINVEELLVADKLFIIFWLRANTYKDSGYTVEFDCELCESKSEYEFQIENLEVIDIKEDFDPKRVLTLGTGDKVSTRLLSIKDESNVKNFLSRNKRSLQQFDEEILTIANLIETINDNNTSLIDKYNYIVNMNPIDFAKIETYLEHYDMGIRPEMNVTCMNCGGTSPLAVSFRSEFFVPKAKLN